MADIHPKGVCMEVIIVLVSLIGYWVSGFDFPTLHFYISLTITLYKTYKHYTNDKTARR